MASQEQRNKAAAQTTLYLVVIAAIVVVANILSFGAYKRVDVTANERYTLSKGSGRLVADLKGPVQVDAYVTKGLAQLDAFVRDLTDLLKEYERAGKGNFKFTIIEAKSDEQKEAAKEAGLQQIPFAETSATGEEKASIAQGFMGLVFKYGSEKAVIPQLAPGRSEGLEFWITNKIREIRDKADDIKHRIGVITGKDELKLTDTNLVPRQGGGKGPSIQSILQQAFPFYTIETVDLKNGDEKVDQELKGLIITQPRKEYTETELRRIDQFMMLGGKSLAIFASAATMKPNDATMNVELNTWGLDKLTEGYGIKMEKNAVFDSGSQLRIPIMTQGGIGEVRHPGIAHLVNDPRFPEETKLLDTGFAGFFRMQELVFPFPSSLEIVKDKQPADVNIKAVARTSEAAAADTSGTISMKLKKEWAIKGERKQQIIAAVAEGKLKSAFGGGEKDGIKIAAQAPDASRVLVVASGQFLTNPFAYSGNGPELGGQFQMFGGVGGDQLLQQIAQPYAQRYLTGTILSIKNTLDWMAGDADLLAASAKILSDPNLVYPIPKPKFSENDDEEALRKKDEQYRDAKKEIQKKVQWTLTLGIPFFFAAFGLIRWRLREGRKNKRVPA